MFSLPSNAESQTFSRISPLETTSPVRRASTWSTANSLAVNEIGRPPRATSRVLGSSVRSPTWSTTGRGGAPRRTSARRRATNTGKLNGFVR